MLISSAMSETVQERPNEWESRFVMWEIRRPMCRANSDVYLLLSISPHDHEFVKRLEYKTINQMFDSYFNF